MAISLNDFKEGGKLRRFVTQIGLLDKIDSANVDQKDLLARLMNSIRHSSVVLDKNKDTWSYDEELDNTEVLEDDEINPKVEEPKKTTKKEKPKEEETKEENELPQVDDIIEEEASWVYVNNEESWNESYTNGALKDYYEANPTEDLWNSSENRAANYNDRVYEGTLDGESTQCSVEWASDNAQKLTFSTGEYYAAIFYELDPKDIELFTDVELTVSTGKTFNATSVHYSDSCQHSYRGAVNAPESTLPWVVISIPKGFTGVIKCDYKGEVSYPFGEEQKTFNKGYAIVAKSEIAPTGTFAKTKLKVYLVHTA